MPLSETPRHKPSGFMALVWALFFFFVFALIVVIWVRGSGHSDAVEDKRAAARQTKLQELVKADNEKLHGSGWIDQAKGVVHIPIADAKRLVVAELKLKAVAASPVKVEPPLPMPPPPDPNATEPPPSALPSSPQGADTIRFDLPQNPPPTMAAPSAAPVSAAAAAQAPLPAAPAPAPAEPARPPLLNPAGPSPAP